MRWHTLIILSPPCSLIFFLYLSSVFNFITELEDLLILTRNNQITADALICRTLFRLISAMYSQLLLLYVDFVLGASVDTCFNMCVMLFMTDMSVAVHSEIALWTRLKQRCPEAEWKVKTNRKNYLSFFQRNLTQSYGKWASASHPID